MPRATSPWAPEGLHLALEDRLEPKIVAAGGQRRGVGGKRDRGNRRPVPLVADHELGGDVLGIRGTPAVAEQQHLAACANALSSKREARAKGALDHPRGRLKGLAVLGKLALQQAGDLD